ncbi:MAG: hypothetical protein Q9219_006009 [cf. Caloplaca sp. 3 TL-2023]
MSRVPNGTNGHVNGDYNSMNANRFHRPHQNNGPLRIGPDHRAGGYGGFESGDSNLPVPEDTEVGTLVSLDHRSDGTNNPYGSSRYAPGERGHEGWQSTSGTRDRDGSQFVAASYGDGPGGRQIEDVLQHINEKWEVMASEECVPVHVALQLMDNSSLGRGRDYQDFQRTNRHLQKALRSIVNEHHQGFNSSIGTFHKIQSSIQTSQARVRSLRESVLNAKSNLMTAKPELQDLGSFSQRYEAMLHVLEQIEKLQKVPEVLDARIAEKQFLAAVDILQDALRMIRKSEMENIGALSDLWVYFSNQETMSEDSSWNLQADSFRYIHTLLEALDRLGCLDVAVEHVEQRLPVELFTIVDRTNQEVDLRHPLHLRATGRLEDALLNHRQYNSAGRSDVLEDLLWTLYSKFEAIAEGHRVVHDVILGIARRTGLRRPENLTGSFKELWKLYQSELRSLLHDYLATDENTLNSSGRPSAGDTNSFQSTRRDKSKRVFKIDEVDQKASNFTAEQEELDRILQSSVPGLVSKSRGRSGIQAGKDRVSKGGPATHKLLTESSVFNIAILLPPSLSFLQRLKDIVPLDSDIAVSTLTSFLDDFLVNVFLPQFEETVTELCGQAFTSLDAFHQSPGWQKEAARPILKSTSVFLKLIRSFCRLLDSLPEDQSFTQPILSQLVAYYDRCCDWFKSLVQRGSIQAHNSDGLKPAATMTKTSQLRNILEMQWGNEPSGDNALIHQEIDYLLSETKEAPLVPTDIISDPKTVSSLCLLYSSMQWLAAGLTQIRHVVEESQSTKRASTRPHQTRRWTLLEMSQPASDEGPVHLPMNHEAAATFDGIVLSIRTLALDALFTLQVDIRCGIAHMMAQVLKTPYLLPYPNHTPDSSVLSLNSDLVHFNDALSTYLRPREHRFITTGLAALVDTLLVANATQIQSMNANGGGRMQLHILVLQQNLKSIEGDVSLSRSARFFELFAEGADTVVARVKEGDRQGFEFSLEESKALVELCHSEGLQSTQRETSILARKKLTEHLKQLEESMQR